MIEKNINSRIKHKHDIEANWAKALNFIPKAGEIIIYDADENNSTPRIKIGDGETTVKDLVFTVSKGGSWYDLTDRPIVTTEISGEPETVTVPASESIVSQKFSKQLIGYIENKKRYLHRGAIENIYINDELFHSIDLEEFFGKTEGISSITKVYKRDEAYGALTCVIKLDRRTGLSTITSIELPPMAEDSTVTLVYKYPIEEFKEEYIPDTIARKSDILEQVQVDWNQNNHIAPDYIKNKPFYTSDVIFEWDGFIDRGIFIKDADGSLYHKIGEPIAAEEINSFVMSAKQKDSISMSSNLTPDEEGFWTFNNQLINIPYDDYIFNGTPAKAGLYHLPPNLVEYYVSGIRCAKKIVHQMDSKYIKDMYYDNGVKNETLIEDWVITGFEEEYDGNYIFAGESPFNLEEGQTYQVVWDGVNYEFVASSLAGMLVFIGDGSYLTGEEEIKYPFLIGVASNQIGIYTNSPDESHTITVKNISKDLKHIDIKYLPIIKEEKKEVFSFENVEFTGQELTFPLAQPIKDGFYDVTFDGKTTTKVNLITLKDGTGVCVSETYLFRWDNNSIEMETKGGLHSFKLEKVDQVIKEEHIPEDINVQDWNENDPTNSAYIKNRTHYEESIEDVVLDEISCECVLQGQFAGWGNSTEALNIIEGNTYIVTWNGDEYPCVCKTYNEAKYLGNTVFGEDTAVNDLVGNRTNEPFLFIVTPYTDEYQYMTIRTEYDEGVYTLKIRNRQTNIHHLDHKYIKDMYYEDDGILFEWDGDTSNLEYFEPVYRIGDSILLNDVIGKTFTINTPEGLREFSITYEDLQFPGNGVWGYQFILNVPNDNCELDGLFLPKAGLYQIDPALLEGMYLAKIAGEPKIQKIDKKYLPDLVGKDVTDQSFTIDGNEVTAQQGAEIFNNYNTNIATGAYSHAEGNNTKATGTYAHAEGSTSTASGMGSHAEGLGSTASEQAAHAEGMSTSAKGTGSHAEGQGTYALGMFSHAEGLRSKAIDQAAHAEGQSTTASGIFSHAEGVDTKASGIGSHAEGGLTEATGQGSHAEGSYTTASGDFSHAEGDNTIASGVQSHTEGSYTVAKGNRSHAEGAGNEIRKIVSGDANTLIYTVDNTDGLIIGSIVSYSFEDSNGTLVKYLRTITEIDEDNSTITLDQTLSSSEELVEATVQALVSGIASGNTSHIEGMGTVAAGESQHVQGKYNLVDTYVDDEGTPGKYSHIIGNGNSINERSNAHTVDWSGNAWYAGDVYVGSTSGTNRDEGSKKLATEEYVDNALLNVSGSSAKPDWNQNDENADDYIKNRTHYMSNILFEWDGIRREEYESFYTPDRFLYARISDYIPEEEFVNSTLIIDTQNGLEEVSKNDINNTPYWNLLWFQSEDSIYNEQFVRAGIYHSIHPNPLEQKNVIKVIGSEAKKIHYLDPKYIKDMYYDKGSKITTLIDNQSFEGFSRLLDDSPFYEYYIEESPFNLKEQAMYEVIWDGITYNLPSVSSGFGSIFIGNENYGDGIYSGDIPFIIINSENSLSLVTSFTEESHTISLKETFHDLKQIDEKYLSIIEEKERIEIFNEDNVVCEGRPVDFPFNEEISNGIYDLTINGKTTKINFTGDDSYKAAVIDNKGSYIDVEDGTISIYIKSRGTYSIKIEKVSKKIKEEYIPEVKMDMDTIELTSIVLKSPNGTRFTIAVGDDGVLTATQIVLPR